MSLDEARIESTPPAAQGLFHDEDGNLREMYVGADIDGDGDVDRGDLGEFLAALADPIGYQQQYPDRFIRADLNADGTVNQADLGIFLAIMGMSENNAVWARFTWDAEDRLVCVEPAPPVEDDRKLKFVYVCMGRRAEKKLYTYQSGDWTVSDCRRSLRTPWAHLAQDSSAPHQPTGPPATQPIMFAILTGACTAATTAKIEDRLLLPPLKACYGHPSPQWASRMPRSA